MRQKFGAGWLLSLFSSLSLAQVPAADLMKPPADARHFIIQSTGGKHGDSWSWVAGDGTRMGRESMNIRGQVWDVDFAGTPGTDHMPSAMTIRGITPQGDAAESFSIASATARWRSPVDAGSSAYSRPAFYNAQGGPIATNAWLLERLIASPDHTLDLLPGGRAHAAKLSTLEVGHGDAQRQTITLWAVTGIGTAPVPMWADAKDRFFGFTIGIAWLPEAYADEQQRMEAAQTAAMALKTAELAKSLVKVPTQPVAFVNVRMFDADTLRFLPGQTVVVDKGEIIAVGPAASIKVPASAQVIKGHGMTLVPGLWDCHMHVGDDYTGLQELSMGITSVRDPGNDDALTIDRRTRAAAGRLLFPHVYPSSLIDGKGPYTAQVANVATSQAEAIAWVDKAKAKPDLPASRSTAHSIPPGCRQRSRKRTSSGCMFANHIPVGIRPLDAINDGDDEVTHINWIIMQAMPDSVIAVSNGIMRFEGPGRYGKDVDLDGGARCCRRLSIRWPPDTSTAIRRWWHLRACTCQTMATCHRLTRRSSVPCRRRPSGVSERVDLPCRRI